MSLLLVAVVKCHIIIISGTARSTCKMPLLLYTICIVRTVILVFIVNSPNNVKKLQSQKYRQILVVVVMSLLLVVLIVKAH